MQLYRRAYGSQLEKPFGNPGIMKGQVNSFGIAEPDGMLLF